MTVLALFAVGVLVLANAFFVIAEYSLVRSRRPRLVELAESGAGGARLALREVDAINDYISACQVGITMASIGIGAIGEPTVAKLLEPVLGNVVAHGVAVAISVVIAYLVITSVHIVFGELVPKLAVLGDAEAIVRRTARPLHWFRVLFHPFIVVLNGVSLRVLRLLGIDPAKRAEEGGSPEEIRRIIAESMTGGKLDPGEGGMLAGVFHLHEQQARQVMTPAPAVVTVDVSEDVETALRRCIDSGHTRMVVTEDDNPDRVKGIVHANQLAQLLLAEGRDAGIEALVREAPIVPETKPLDDLLADLQRQRSSLAVVADEYGRTAGIVTVEDIIEEVVGEIDDETDPLGGAVRKLANGDWFVRGHVAITDLADYGLALPVDSDAYNSVGGYVFGELGRLPKRGDTVSSNGYSIRVESVRENRIEAVRIRERRVA
jgi:CBS domain containing-hemolysin-like protein